MSEFEPQPVEFTEVKRPKVSPDQKREFHTTYALLMQKANQAGLQYDGMYSEEQQRVIVSDSTVNEDRTTEVVGGSMIIDFGSGEEYAFPYVYGEGLVSQSDMLSRLGITDPEDNTHLLVYEFFVDGNVRRSNCDLGESEVDNDYSNEVWLSKPEITELGYVIQDGRFCTAEEVADR